MVYEQIIDFPEHGRWELFEGKLYIQPMPSFGHQEVIGGLTLQLLNQHHLRPDLPRPYSGLGVWPLSASHSESLKAEDFVVPDFTLIRKEQLIHEGCLGPPDAIIEVTSKDTYWADFIMKTRLYRNVGVPWYLIIDPGRGAHLTDPGGKTSAFIGGCLEICSYTIDLDHLFENLTFKPKPSVSLEEALELIREEQIFGDSDKED